MSSDKILIFIFSTLFCLCSCSDDNSQNLVTSWGKEEFYEDFMWKKYVPDTLYRQIAFDFNDDAKNYMTEPLQLGLFKKTDSGIYKKYGKHIRKTDSHVFIVDNSDIFDKSYDIPLYYRHKSR